MNKKTIIIIVIIFVFMVGVFIFIAPKCETTDTERSCGYILDFALSLHEQKCKNQDGKWDCYGGQLLSNSILLPSSFCNCHFPLNDADKECTNSNECNGDCVVELEYIKEKCSNFSKSLTQFECKNIKGKCTKYIKTIEERRYQLNNGIITYDPIMLY